MMYLHDLGMTEGYWGENKTSPVLLKVCWPLKSEVCGGAR